MYIQNVPRGKTYTILFPLVAAGATDYITSGPTFAAGDSQVSIDGAAFSNTSNTPTYIDNGLCSLVLTDTEMQGSKIIVTLIDSATKVWEDQTIILETVQADGGFCTDIATLASQTEFTLAEGSADDDAYNGWALIVTDASTDTQQCIGIVSDYVGSTKTVTLSADPAIFTMAAGDYVKLIPAVLNGAVSATVTSIGASALSAITSELDANSTIASEVTAVKAKTDELTFTVSNQLDVNALAVAGAVTTAITSDIDSNSTLTTTLAAVKAKTDSLTFTVAGVVDSNIQRINDVVITGDGQSGTEFSV